MAGVPPVPRRAPVLESTTRAIGLASSTRETGLLAGCWCTSLFPAVRCLIPRANSLGSQWLVIRFWRCSHSPVAWASTGRHPGSSVVCVLCARGVADRSVPFPWSPPPATAMSPTTPCAKRCSESLPKNRRPERQSSEGRRTKTTRSRAKCDGNRKTSGSNIHAASWQEKGKSE